MTNYNKDKNNETFNVIMRLLESGSISTLRQLEEAKAELIKTVEKCAKQILSQRNLADDFDPIQYIYASQVTVEVVDNQSKRHFSRTLPMVFEETDNGIILTGEDLTGQESKLVFLSEKGMRKIEELQGAGSDKPLCKHDI